MRQDLGLVIAAGGSSSRFGGGDKLWADLCGKPVFLYSVERLSPVAGQSVLVVPENQVEAYREKVSGIANVDVVAGGPNRRESVMNGVRALPKNITMVAVVDAARPLTTAELLKKCVASARRFGSGVAAHRVTDTIQVADASGVVVDTPARERLWAAETPQVFWLSWELEGYLASVMKNILVTDDAQAVRLAGHPVRLVENTEPNLKITHREDLLLAQALLERGKD